MSVYVPTRFLALVDNLAAKNKVSRSSLLSQIFVLGLHAYAELYHLAPHVITGESRPQEGTHP